MKQKIAYIVEVDLDNWPWKEMLKTNLIYDVAADVFNQADMPCELIKVDIIDGWQRNKGGAK